MFHKLSELQDTSKEAHLKPEQSSLPTTTFWILCDALSFLLEMWACING